MRRVNLNHCTALPLPSASASAWYVAPTVFTPPLRPAACHVLCAPSSMSLLQPVALAKSPLVVPYPGPYQVLALHCSLVQNSAQNKARTNYETMGGTWAGMASTIKNPAILFTVKVR